TLYTTTSNASQSLAALSAMALNTSLRSVGDFEMTRSISEVALCCSRACASSPASRVTSRSLLEAERARLRAAFDAVAPFALIVGCPFAGLRLVARRRFTWLSPWRTYLSLAHQQVRCAAQQNPRSEFRDGSKPAVSGMPALGLLLLSNRTLSERVGISG